MNAPRTAARIGVLTVSDRASSGEYEDRGGPAVRDYLHQVLAVEWEAISRVVPDEVSAIARAIIEMADVHGCCMVITTGGTGPAPRDVTPEATETACEKMLPGYGEIMRAESLKHVPTAILSRQTAGVRGTCLVINLPGQPKAVRECLDAVMPATPYCVELIGGPILETDPRRVQAFRPKKK